MATNHVQPGNTIDYTNGGTAIASGDFVIFGGIPFIAQVDIANGETGSIMRGGVWDLLAVDGAAFTLGEGVTFDVSAGRVDDAAATPASGDVQGISAVVMETKTTGTDENIRVLLTGVPGTVT
jgi:predicted RecA/RadA family phage recombinase